MVTSTRWPSRLSPGRPDPLGASWDGLGVNFALFSANAEQVELCLFDAAGRHEIGRFQLPECTDEVWHGYLPDAKPGLLYGYRVHGPYDPKRGHRFNPHKLLLDPYARRLAGDLRWSDALFGYRVDSPRSDLSFDRRDSAAAMPKGVVDSPAFNWGDDRSPATPFSSSVIYEAHAKGFTLQRQDLDPRERGHIAALADPRVIDHLLRLGVTAIELMPIQAFLQDRFLVSRGLRNYWGYSTLNFFAPEPQYLVDGALDEIRVAVRRLHKAGIEVILDVVYNHTCEGNGLGPTLSFRGIDNASYYRLVPGDERQHINDTGTGNTLNLTHPRVLQMVMDSLRYWVHEFHVDGFRFDLGANLGREAGGFDPGSGFFDAVRQDPVLSRLKLISEPWDIGPGGYQLGNHPPGFAEWNDQFRDSVRRFWRGDAGQRPGLAASLAGSAQLFDHHRRRPWASVNFVASHDGFTLNDLVSYVEKHNDANGENGQDGHNDNYSANWGAEGPTDSDDVASLREQVKRSIVATVFVSLGTPMLLAGDEFGRTQNGNNNAYCQDNEISWLDWSRFEATPGRELAAFVADITAARRKYASLRNDRFPHGRDEVLPGVPDISWFDEAARPMVTEAWNDPNGRLLTLRRAVERQDGNVEVSLVLFNASEEARSFDLPEPAFDWRIVVDTCAPGLDERPVTEQPVAVEARGLVLVVAVTKRQ